VSCSVCSHEHVREIDMELTRGVGVRNVAKRWGLSKSSVHRHAETHISEKLAKTAEIERQADGESLMGEIRDLKARAEAILNTAETAKDLKTALSAIGQIKGVLELTAKIAEIVLHERALREQSAKRTRRESTSASEDMDRPRRRRADPTDAEPTPARTRTSSAPAGTEGCRTSAFDERRGIRRVGPVPVKRDTKRDAMGRNQPHAESVSEWMKRTLLEAEAADGD